MSASELDPTAGADAAMLALRKPTEIRRAFDAVPKPKKSVPKNGLPAWHRLSPGAKLPVPGMPIGKVVFSRGKIGENIRRFVYPEGPTEFNNSDPYSTDLKKARYELTHDPHLALHFSRPSVRAHMAAIGAVTGDGRAVCRLAEFNDFRKFLFFQYMDRVHVEIKKMQEYAEDTLALRRADRAAQQRYTLFVRSERENTRRERNALLRAEELAEKKRLSPAGCSSTNRERGRAINQPVPGSRASAAAAVTSAQIILRALVNLWGAKEQQKKLKRRMQHLAEFKEKLREEFAARAREKEEQLKRRVAAAEDGELRRTVTLMRNWRINEKKRIERLQQEKENREKMIQEQANKKWQMRVEAENEKIAQEKLLTKIYTDVMAHNANARMRKAETYEYNNELNYQQLRMNNLRKLRGSPASLIRKMGLLFEETKRGSKGMSVALALGLADVAVNHALSVQGNPFLGMARARGRMELETNQPAGVLRLMEEIIETAMMEFTRGHATRVLCDVEMHCYEHFRNLYSGPPKKRKRKVSRWIKVQKNSESENFQSSADTNGETRRKLSFGNVKMIEPDEPMSDIELYPTRNRPPTPYPTMTEAAELAFLDRPDDIPSPTAIGASPLPEKEKMLEDLMRANNLMKRFIIESMLKGIHLDTWKITMPPLKHMMEWGEAVECLAKLLMNSQIEPFSTGLRRVADFLTRRVMHFLQVYIKEDRWMKKNPQPEPKVEEEQAPEPQQQRQKLSKKKK